MSSRIVILNSLIILLGAPFLLFAWLAPFSFFVDIEYVDHQDVCAGESIQTVFSMRNVKWSDSYEGHITAELYRYEDGYKYETVIRRDDTFIYQKSDEEVRYQIEWNNAILEPGEYGVSSLVTIDPVFKKQDYQGEDEQKFNVINCYD